MPITAACPSVSHLRSTVEGKLVRVQAVLDCRRNPSWSGPFEEELMATRMHNPPHPGEVIKSLCLEPLGVTGPRQLKRLG